MFAHCYIAVDLSEGCCVMWVVCLLVLVRYMSVVLATFCGRVFLKDGGKNVDV